MGPAYHRWLAAKEKLEKTHAEVEKIAVEMSKYDRVPDDLIDAWPTVRDRFTLDFEEAVFRVERWHEELYADGQTPTPEMLAAYTEMRDRLAELQAYQRKNREILGE
jgi:hypothetical protein